MWSVECPLESSLRVEHYFLDDRYETDIKGGCVLMRIILDAEYRPLAFGLVIGLGMRAKAPAVGKRE